MWPIGGAAWQFGMDLASFIAVPKDLRAEDRTLPITSEVAGGELDARSMAAIDKFVGGVD